MEFKLKINPEVFSTPDRKNYTITNIKAYPIGIGEVNADGVDQLKFYFSFLGDGDVVFADATANVEIDIILPDGSSYALLSNLFNSDTQIKYEAMNIVAWSFGYTALPMIDQ